MIDRSLYGNLLFGLVLTLAAFCITWVMQKRVKILDLPGNRSSHASPMPKSGGVGIVVIFFLGMAWIYLRPHSESLDQPFVLGFVISAVLIAIISFYDDINSKSPTFKMATHVVAVLIALYFDIVVDKIAVPGVGYVELGWIAYPLSFFWMVGLTNAYNFMDGLDGLASGVAVIVSLFFIIISYLQGSDFVHLTCYVLLAGSLGFYSFNFPPAKIFLGDVGSAFLGFTFAALAIIAARYDNSRTSFLVIPLLLFNFIYDALFTFVRRLLAGEKVTEAHRSHLYQLLHRIGYSHLEVSLMHYCVCFLQGLGAIWMIQVLGNERVLIFVPFLLWQGIYTLLVVKKSRELDLI